MDTIKIYLAGAMSGLSYEGYMSWRIKFTHDLEALAKDYNVKSYLNIFNPCMYYNIEEKLHKTEREPFEFDMYNLKNSNLVVANVTKPDSIGTCMELAVAKDKGIPVIALNESNIEQHPWVNECCTRICTTMNELVYHVFDYYVAM